MLSLGLRHDLEPVTGSQIHVYKASLAVEWRGR
jgi:hypothetical protein